MRRDGGREQPQGRMLGLIGGRYHGIRDEIGPRPVDDVLLVAGERERYASSRRCSWV